MIVQLLKTDTFLLRRGVQREVVSLADKAKIILDLLHDPAFQALRVRADREPLLWKEFATLPMPSGYSVEDTWKFLTAMRKHTSHVFPMGSYVYPGEPAQAWYSLDSAIVALTSSIESLVHRQNEYEAGSGGSSSRYDLARLLAEGVSAAARRDGLSVSVADAEELLLDVRKPKNDGEKVVSATLTLLATLPSLEEEFVAPLDMTGFSHKIMQAAPDLPCSESPRALRGDSPVRYTAGRQQEALTVLCELVNRSAERPLQERIPDMTFVSSIVWDFAPFKKWNGLMELVLRHITFLKGGYPFLRWIPFSKLIMAWEQGTLERPEIDFAFDSQPVDIGEGYDGTASLHAHILILATSLEAVCEGLREKDRADRQLLERLPFQSDMNIRQQHILRQAIQNPRVPFRISPHKELYSIAYATARNDFIKLERAGLLVSDYQGKALTFKLNPAIASGREE